MKQLQERLVRELGEIAGRATTSRDALPLIQSRASSYRPEDEEEVVVMLTPEVRKYPRRRWLVPAALGTTAAVVLGLFGLAVLRSDDDDATVEPTLPTETPATVEPTTGPSGDGGWVHVAVDEPWVGSVGEIAALPGGGYIAVIAATRAGSQMSAVMWSPDGVEWFDGDPEREIELPNSGWYLPQLAVTSDRVVVVDGTDLSDHVPLAIGDPRNGAWDRVALEYAALESRTDGVEFAGLAASTNDVLVAAYSAPDDAAGMLDVVTWVVDPTTGTSETDSFRLALRQQEGTWPPPPPVTAWVDGRWIMITGEDVPGSEGEAQRSTLWTSSDGLEWSQADLPDGMVGVSSLEAGPQGVAATNCTMGGPDGVPDAIWFSTDGLEWTRVTQGTDSRSRSTGGHQDPVIAAGEFGFVQIGGDSLRVVAADGSEVYRMDAPFDVTTAAASSGDTLLILAEPGLWLYSAVT